MSPQLQKLQAAAEKKLKLINVEGVPYDVGYWCCQAGMTKPSIKDRREAEAFTEGWNQAKSDSKDPLITGKK